MQIRLFVPRPLVLGETVALPDSQAHYLRNVLRASVGDSVYLFNGESGEFTGKIAVLDKKAASVSVAAQTKPPEHPRAVSLYFTPLKRDCTDWLVEKATELGVTRLCPVLTDFAAVKRINPERMESIAIEACEQSRRLTVPQIVPMQTLKEMLAARKKEDGILFHLDESGAGASFKQALQGVPANAPVSFLIGGEGGFSNTERALIKETPATTGISLGSHILRAETAGVTVLAALLCAG